MATITIVIQAVVLLHDGLVARLSQQVVVGVARQEAVAEREGRDGEHQDHQVGCQVQRLHASQLVNFIL